MDKEKKGIFNYIKLRKKYNTLKNKYETLLETTKEDCFNAIFQKINDELDVNRLRQENKNLRLKNKSLKEIIKEENYGRNNRKTTRTKSSIRNKSRSRTKSK